VNSIIAAMAAPYSIRLAKAWWSACDVAIEVVLKAQRAGYYGIALLPAKVDPGLVPSAEKEAAVGGGIAERAWS
jgi:hypothetical protein